MGSLQPQQEHIKKALEDMYEAGRKSVKATQMNKEFIIDGQMAYLYGKTGDSGYHFKGVLEVEL